MGQNNIHDAIVGFNLESITTRINEDLNGFCRVFEAFSSRLLTLTEAGGLIDRKSLYNWKKHGLLPFTEGPKKKGKDKTWGRFSFIELCWLKMLKEFRQVGVGIEKLKEIKAFFFPPGFIDTFYSIPVSELEKLSPKALKQAEEKQLIKDGMLQLTPEVRQIFEDMQFTLFSCVLYATILSRRNYVFYADGNGKYDVIDLNQLTIDPIAGVTELQRLLNSESVVFVNIKKIIADISGTHEVFSKELKLGERMSESSVNILKNLFKDGQIKEITLRVNQKGRPLLWVRREPNFEDFEREIRRVRKKGNFCDLAVKTRDGQVQYFENSEIVKL